MKKNTPNIFTKVEIVRRFLSNSISLFLFGLIVFLSACSELEKPKTETFYADSEPPAKQEFRWSNGKEPKSFDPAHASAPPETDIVRAVYDGLTETETKSLKAIPAIALKWESSDDFKKWTFILRHDAKWSNGKKVVANDFVRSWKRLAELGDKVSHHELLNNIVGTKAEEKVVKKKASKDGGFSVNTTQNDLGQKQRDVLKSAVKNNDESLLAKDKEATSKNSSAIDKEKAIEREKTPPEEIKKTPKTVSKKNTKPVEFGVKAIGSHRLEISLIKSDKDFPKLVTHPIFRPVYANGKEFDEEGLNADIVTSGAFRISSVGKDGVTLDRSEHYYNKENIKLERVRFVPTKDAESALEAYKSGEIDAVTNAYFEPLALKILTPYIDFKRTTHSALNFYEFNRKVEPFNDRRVRQALAISIDRERITQDEMKGATKPAYNFLPYSKDDVKVNLEQQVDKAKGLLEKAGFPNGENFPKVKLVINRNNVQKKIAKSVAKMWKDNLNIDTEIIVKEFDELEISKNEGTYDVIRRGVVLPTSDETANMLAIFSPKKTPKAKETSNAKEKLSSLNSNLNSSLNNNLKQTDFGNLNSNSSFNSSANSGKVDFTDELLIDTGDDEKIILTEEEAIMEVPAIPLYFPRSYSLVKPYVEGFEMNTLDAPSLKDVEINNNWQPKKTDDES